MMSTLDVFCLPTLREGFGLVFAEAMAMKLPVVTSPEIDPIPEVVLHNETGILVPLGEEDLFAKAILSLIVDDPLAKGRDGPKKGGEGLKRISMKGSCLKKRFGSMNSLIQLKDPGFLKKDKGEGTLYLDFNSSQHFLFLFSLAFLSFIGTYLFRKIAHRFQIMDIPNIRSSHSKPTPRGGGVAIFFSFTLLLILTVLLSQKSHFNLKFGMGIGLGWSNHFFSRLLGGC